MRTLPLSDADRAAMLATIGAGAIEDLFVDVPAVALQPAPIAGLPLHASERAVERHMAALSARALSAGQAPFFCGAGAYRHHVPASVDHLIQRGEFLTAYTPYQPEIAQGTLQVLFEFQTQVARLFGCEVANASLYDGSTACWEAIAMATRITRRSRAVLSGGLHPHYAQVAETMARYADDTLVTLPLDAGASTDDAAVIAAIDGATAAVVVQYPDVCGRIPDLAAIAAAARAQGALTIAVVTDPVALGLLESPGTLGADIVVGEGQALGVGLQFGGPYLGLFACAEKHVRQMPGRLCGQTVDADGRRGFVLTLSTREQHIRREKATSNICTNSGLCALAFSIHLTLLGGEGLARMARASHARAVETARALAAIPGVEVLNRTWFAEFAVRVPGDAARLVDDMAARGVLGGVPLSRLLPDRADLADVLLITASECTDSADIAALVGALEATLVEQVPA